MAKDRKAYKAKYYRKHRKEILSKKKEEYDAESEKMRERARKFYQENNERLVAKARKYRSLHPERIQEANRRRRDKVKLAVLTYYSPDGILNCSWPDCQITDIDCLTLDHVNNDGGWHRKENKIHGGADLYLHVMKSGFPSGYQTLCGGHQFKKEIYRKRGIKSPV